MQPPDIVILAEGWHRLLDTFKSFPEKEREAAEELIRDPKHLHDIARDLNCDATDPMFLELLRRIIGVCKQVCPVDVEQLFSDNGTHRLASTLLNGNDDLEQVARRLRRNPGSQQFRQEVLRVLLQALDHARKSLLECATDGEELNLPEEVRP